MATLAECMTAYAREMWARMLFFNEVPPWEQPSLYSWTPTQFRMNLHKTGDPGEAGTFATNQADYSGYAPITVARGVGAWTLDDSGGDTPTIEAGALVWPEVGSSTQDIYAISIALRLGSTDYPIARVVLSSPVTFAAGESPSVDAGNLTIKFR